MNNLSTLTTGNGRHHLPILPQVVWHDHEYARLLMRLDLYNDLIVATRFERDSDGEASFIVDPHDLAAALGGLDLNTGLLPPNCLFWQKRDGQERLGVYLPPQIWTLRVEPTDTPNRTIPLPGLVFVGRGTRYSLYALATDDYPTAETPLYIAPLPNVNTNVCHGNVEFPVASAGTMMQAVALFFESGFNTHLDNGKSQKYPRGILRMWRVLHRAKATRYPVADLVKTYSTLGDIIKGGLA